MAELVDFPVFCKVWMKQVIIGIDFYAKFNLVCFVEFKIID